MPKKVALIVGGAGGIGGAVARAFKQDDYQVALADIDGTRLKAMAQELGGDTLRYLVDVRSEASVRKLIRSVLIAAGRVDLLFGGHGVVTGTTKLSETPLKEWNFVLSTNLTGAFLCLKYVSSPMIRQQSGCVINLTTNPGRGGRAPYASSKLGIEGLTASAAEELRPHKIGVYAVSPSGYLSTYFHDNSYKLLRYRNYVAEDEIRKNRKPIKPEVVVPLCRYLAEDTTLALSGKKIDSLEWNEANGLGRDVWYASS